LIISVSDDAGRELICYRPKPKSKAKAPLPATEPTAPEKIKTNDELFITGRRQRFRTRN
jgi:hypothetical protein